MEFTQHFWVGLLVGAVLGFILCRVMRMRSAGPHDTGPHKDD